MIQIVVLLTVKDKNCFEKFERKAIEIMKNYEGKLIVAFEPNKTDSTSKNIDEVHCLEFPSIDAFNKYRQDPSLLDMSGLRNKAILNTTIFVSAILKDYA